MAKKSHEHALQGMGIMPIPETALLSIQSPLGIGIRRAIGIVHDRNRSHYNVPEFLWRLQDKQGFLNYTDVIARNARRIGSNLLENELLPQPANPEEASFLRVSDIARFRQVLSLGANSHSVFVADSETNPTNARQFPESFGGKPPRTLQNVFRDLNIAINGNPNWNQPFSMTLVQRGGENPVGREFHIFIDALKNYKFRALISYSQESLGSWSFAIRRFNDNGDLLEPPIIRLINEEDFTKTLADTWDVKEGKGSVIALDTTSVRSGVQIGMSPAVKVETPFFIDRLMQLWLDKRKSPFEIVTDESLAGVSFDKPVRMDHFTFGQEIPQGERLGRRVA
jgi:hypothetical protein